MNDYFLQLYEKTIKWQKQKKAQSSSHRTKKASAKKRSAKKVKGDAELKRLAKIVAKRHVKNAVSKQMYRKTYGDLSESEKERIRQKMKEKVTQSKVNKETARQFKIKKDKQDAKIKRAEAKLKKKSEKKAEPKKETKDSD